MLRLILSLSLCLAMPAQGSGSSGMPDHNTPRELAEAWLRFHEADLCQGVDAVFVFREKAMEITGQILDEKNYDKFQEMLRPLRGTYNIEFHLDTPQEEAKTEEKKDKDKDPPASLWENYELRSYLGDPFARAKERTGFDEDPLMTLPPPDEMLKQRLMIYAEQTLSWNGKIERYAKHLPALTRFAADPGVAHGLRSRANDVSKAHAREMERLLGKLSGHLEPAMPHSGKAQWVSPSENSGPAPKTIVDRADQISDYARSVSLRVYQFIHPEQYTVGLDELRQPSLLESLKSLQKMDSEFVKAFAKTR